MSGGGAPSSGSGAGGERSSGSAAGGARSTAPERALARIDLGAIERNCARLREELSEGTRLCAVVKADAYGHGAKWVARSALEGGADKLAVATAGEAEDLRRHGIAGRILVMGALTTEELRIALEADADVVAWRPGFERSVGEHAIEGAARPRVHVKYDTGMGRLGERDPDAVLALADAVAADDHLDLAGIWTHFATADEPDSDFFGEQLGRFAKLAERVRAEHPDLLVHAANSAATLRDPASHFDMARCGIAIYGLDPFHSDPFARGLEPALELRSYVAEVKPCAPGESAGYGRRCGAERPPRRESDRRPGRR